MKLAVYAAAAIVLVAAPGALAWGQEGHEIVATIAELHLSASAKSAVCAILRLDESPDCHLAAHAMFADTWKRTEEGKWSAPTHYINPIDDNPPSACMFGQNGWDNTDCNILTAIVNQTQELTKAASPKDQVLPLKLLIHLIGDMHQPLHLCGRDRGGNEIQASFGNKHDNLHALWDNYFVQLLVAGAEGRGPDSRKDVSSPGLESLLAGKKYDGLIRFIEMEGIQYLWRNEVASWQTCPGGHEDSALAGLLGSSSHGQSVLATRPSSHLDALLACPFAWAQGIASLNCEYVWTPDMDKDGPAVDLEGDYWDIIESDVVISKLLAQGGLRLAAVLNAALSQS